MVCEMGHIFGYLYMTLFIFHNVWDVILPIDELHHFSRWLKRTTKQLIGFFLFGRLFCCQICYPLVI